MKLSSLTAKQVSEATTKIRREVRQAEEAALRGDRGEAYAAAERAQEAAFELKQLFGLTDAELEVENAARLTGFGAGQ